MSNNGSVSYHSSFIYLISAIAAVAGMLFGYDTGVISGAILFIGKEFALSATQVGAVVSAVLLGALLGSSLSGRVTDYIGRRRVLMLASIIFIIASIASALASTVTVLLISRLILGVAIGIASYAAPLYLAEVAPAELRGMLVSLNQLAITIGIVVSYFADLYFAKDENWRGMLAFGIVPALILLIGMIFLPESPRWLMLKGLRDKAKSILAKVRPAAQVEGELNTIASSLSGEKGTLRDLFTQRLRPVLLITVGLAFFQQATGINTIIYYAPTIFQMAGFENASTAILTTLGIGVINVLFTILSLFMIDRLGRKPLLYVGMIGMMISLFCVGLVFNTPDLEFGRWIAVACIVLYVACFAISLGPIAWLMISEVFPLQMRATGTSLATGTVWLFNMLVAFTFPILLSELGKSSTFWMYALFCLLGLVFVKLFVPETKGISLEQIEKNLDSGMSARDLGNH